MWYAYNYLCHPLQCGKAAIDKTEANEYSVVMVTAYVQNQEALTL